MKRFCFGTFIKVLLQCTNPLKKVTQYELGKTLIAAVDEPYVLNVAESIISDYARCERTVASEISDSAADTNRNDVVDYFEQHVISMLDLEMLKKGICAYKDIIEKDRTVDSLFVEAGLVKEQWLQKLIFVPSEVLAYLFLISVKAENKWGKDSVKFINKAYLDDIGAEAVNITFDGRATVSEPVLSKTLKNKYFDNAFISVSTGKLHIKGRNHIKIYRYRIESNRFDYIWLKKLLSVNMGRYVFNRKEIENYLRDEDIEGLGVEASRYARTHSTGNDLGEMLIYAFLEEVLDAPKLLSAIEMNSEHRCAGIHFLTIPGTDEVFELVYGTSDIQGDLNSAVDRAFDAIKDLEINRLHGIELINNAEFKKSVDIKTAHMIKRIVIPEDGDDSSVGTAYGIFLGYTLGLDPENYRQDEFKKAVVEQIEQDINVALVRVQEKIAELKLGYKSFYVYVIPFNNADYDKNAIMRDLVGSAG